MKYQYQKNSRYFAQVANSLKEIGAEELIELGARVQQIDHSGIQFTADKACLYQINYKARMISRVLAPLLSFNCQDTDTLYQMTFQIPWHDFIRMDQTFSVTSNVSNSNIGHSKFAALRLKDAVADFFMDKYGQRPDVSVRHPDIILNLHIRSNRATISMDTSGGALHRRGYRVETVSAPMQETIAATIIRMSKWDGSTRLHDPFCGSGTLLCEALMSYCNVPAGIFRNRFGFEYLPDFDAHLWKKIKREADSKIRNLPSKLVSGSDVSKDAVRASRTNLMGLHFGKNVTVERMDFNNLPHLKKHVLICNPPYGIRLEANQKLDLFYKTFGDFLKHKCKGSLAYIYFGDRQYIKHIGLKTSWKKPIKAGGLDGRLVKYELY